MSVTVVQESSTLPGMYIEILHAIIKPFTFAHGTGLGGGGGGAPYMYIHRGLYSMVLLVWGSLICVYALTCMYT